MTIEKDFIDISILSGTEPGVRFCANMNITTEILKDGRLLPILRSTSGRPKFQLDNVWESSKWMKEYIGKIPVESFQLQLDGQSLNSNWKFKGSFVKDEGDFKHFVLELEHAVCKVEVKIHTKIDGGPFMERWIEIKNTGETPSLLSEISPISGILWLMKNYKEHKIEEPFILGSFTESDFSYEGDFSWQELKNGKFTIEGKNGRSGWGMPFFSVKNKINGECFVCHLEWSANWMAEFTVEKRKASSDAVISFKVGPNSPSPMRIIQPDETVLSPAVHIGHMHGDNDFCMQQLHKHLRKSVLLPKVPGRSLLVGGARVVEGGEKWIKNQIDIAAEMGMEYFMVDAAWNGIDLNNWWNTVGDWNVGDWIQNGLDPVREYIHQKGMLFAIWMEPEAAGTKSKIIKDHPDWAHKRDGNPVADGRLLDLSKKEVAVWVEEQILSVIERLKPDMFKIDFNCQNINYGGENIKNGFIENALWGHVKTIYRIFDKVKKKYPDLILENCAGGGGRNDLGMVRRFDISCESDYTVLPRSLKAVNNMNMAYPPETFKYYYGHWPTYHQFGDYDCQLRVAILTNPVFVGFGNVPEEINQMEKQKIQHHLKIYKDFIRPMLPECLVFQHTPALATQKISDFCVLEYALPDYSKGVIALFKMSDGGESEYVIRPRGIKMDYKYNIYMDNSTSNIEMSGYELMTIGLNIHLESALTSELLLIEKM